MLLENEPIMSERLIWSFRHLECQNPSIISDSLGIPRWKQKTGEKERSRGNRTEESYSYLKFRVLRTPPSSSCRGPFGPLSMIEGAKSNMLNVV